MKTVCFGLLIVFFCNAGEKPVSNNECAIWGPEVRAFYKLTEPEIAALQPARKRALVSLRRKYERLCR